MCLVFIWKQTANSATYVINCLIFITEMKSVYCAVRTGPLNKLVFHSSLKGLTGFFLFRRKRFFLSFTVYTCKISVYVRMTCLYSSVIIVGIHRLDDSRQEKGFFSRSNGPDRLAGPPNLLLLNVVDSSSRVKRPECEVNSLPPSVQRLRMRGFNLCFLPLCVSAVYTIIL
jgi:hypothetical protein